MGSFWWLSFRCCFHWLVAYTNIDWFPYLTGLHKSQNALKIVLLKNWNCFKIPRIWRNSHLFDMLFSQKFQWVLLLQDYFKIQKCDPMLTTQIMLLTKDHFEDFPKEKERFFIGHALFHLVMLLLTYSLHYAFGHALFHFVIFLLTYSAPRTRIWSPTTHSPRFGEKSEIYYSSITIHCYYSLSLFTCTIHSESLPI